VFYPYVLYKSTVVMLVGWQYPWMQFWRQTT